MTKQRIAFIQLIVLTFLFFSPAALSGQRVIDRIEVHGEIGRVPRETILYYFGLRSGYAYEEKAVEKGLDSLWASGLFEDIKIFVSQGERGRVISLELKEYPIVKKLVFETGEKMREREILRRLEERNIAVRPYSVYDPQKMHKIELTIDGMLAERGFDEGQVKIETVKTGKFEVEVHYRITEGRRYRIEEIIFEGEPKLERRLLLEAFQNNREHNLFSWIRGKDILRKAKLDEDLQNLEKKYREHGYAAVRIGNPRIEQISKGVMPGGKRALRKIVIPVEADEKYSLGRIEIEGNEFFTPQQIRALIPSREGALYNGKSIAQAVKKIKESYQDAGYFFVQILLTEHLAPQSRIVDVTFRIHEGERISLHRLKITGNSFTKEKVLRREMLVAEQETFCLDLFQESLEKLMRSEEARIEDDPQISPDPKNPSKIDVHLKVEEIHRDEWQLTGGYSGYQGAFIGGSLSAVDFFGASEKLSLMIEYGERSKNYTVGYLKPYLFDKLVSFRFRLFNKEDVYPGLFDRKGKGMHLGFDAEFEDYWQAGLGYNYERVDVSSYGIEGNDQGSFKNISSISIVLFRDTVKNPLFPEGGMRCMLSAELANGLLGSDIQFIKTEVEGAVFFSFSSCRHIFGLHMRCRVSAPLDDSEMPFWERFYLGGERSIRGYDVYSIGPRNLEGKNVGGEKSLVFNLEYAVPLRDTFFSVFFFDIGNAFRYSERIDLKELYWSAGLELRWWIPRTPIPVRFIFAYNNRLIDLEDSHLAFRIAFGTSF